MNGKVSDSIKIPLNEVKTDGLTLSDEFNNGGTNYFDKRYNYDGYSTPISGLTPEEVNDGAGTQLIKNGNFENGVEPWVSMVDFSESPSVFTPTVRGGKRCVEVSRRSARGEGIKQTLTGVKAGRIYAYSASVRYDGTYTGLSGVEISRGEWGLIQGTFTVPATANLSSVQIIIDIPWWVDEEFPEGANASDYLSDIYVADVSFVQQNFEGDYYRNGEYDYNGSNLGLQWQFNHNPDNRYWSLTDRDGYLRLTNGYISDGFLNAKNTLTQRSFGPFSSATVAMEIGGMKDGDWAGLGALQDFYGFVGVTVEGNQKYLVKYNTIFGVALEEERIPISADRVYLRLDFKFVDGDTDGYDRAYFYYSLDGESWMRFGGSLYMTYRLEHFVGYRFALFSYATKQTGGYVDFDYFRVASEE